MSATVEVENATVEQATAEVGVEEPSQPAEKPAKEKRPKALRERKPETAKTASHPPYFQMIKEALLALNDKSGSSPYAIAKYMEEKHRAVLPANFRKILGLQLKNSAARGKLIKIKASYKLSESDKKDNHKTGVEKAESARKTGQVKSSATAVNGATTRARATKRTEAVMKAVKPAKKVGAKMAKKSVPAKAKPPKSIKSPGAKTAKKVAA